jgi:maleylacetate reductase
MNFVYQSPPVRVVFGRGTLAQVGDEMVKLGKSKVLIITTSNQKDQGKDMAEVISSTKSEMGPLEAILFSGAVMHTPVAVTDEAIKVVEAEKIDCLIAVGGGSSIGLSKAITYRTGIIQIAVPTTYAGSEATPILGQTIGKEKKTLKDSKVQPQVILYDVDLTLTLPKHLILTSGMNAIAHAVEAL